MVAGHETHTPITKVDPSLIGRFDLRGSHLPYLDLNEWPFVGSRIDLDGTIYTFGRSFPVHGHSAIMPQYVAEQMALGKKILVVERDERYYAYVA